ncbi:MAG: hypothetical protein A2X86_07080 [Bdellovibrionales bacterium GWA2_49_15]|nr:MAG: hypothetical protein A2X86_07080 [Bdellovibrionales bacterium GWA2_49_15]
MTKQVLIPAAIYNISGGVLIIFLLEFLGPIIGMPVFGPPLFRLFTGGAAITFGLGYLAAAQDFERHKFLVTLGAGLKYWAFLIAAYCLWTQTISLFVFLAFGVVNLLFALAFTAHHLKKVKGAMVVCLMFLPLIGSAQGLPDVLKEVLKPGFTPSDDPADYPLVLPRKFHVELSEPLWIVPSKNLPATLALNKSNNNVAITIQNGTIFMAFRNSKTHFASKKSKMVVISSQDGAKWDVEAEISLKKDCREPQFVNDGKNLHLTFFSAGTSPFKFEPGDVVRYTRTSRNTWEGPHRFLEKGEVMWDVKKRFGEWYMTSYSGSHYNIFGPSKVDLHFKKSLDGLNYTPVEGRETVYQGGVSETGFEFDHLGNLWGVTRNEDGDQSGFGHQVIFAEKENLSSWQFPEKSSPEIFMSPKMFRHQTDLFLIGRRQLGKHPFDRTPELWGMPIRRLANWLGYSFTPKATTLYKIDQTTKQVHPVLDLPSAGDTAFPSIVRLDGHRFLVANYTSRPDRRKISWIRGQLGQTYLYLILLNFKPESLR